MATISIGRDELLKLLEDAKARADKEDAKAEKKHMADEAALLLRFRAKCREALKWDYETFKKNYFRVGVEDRPYCPQRLARPIEMAITQVKMDTRKGRFRLTDQSDWYRAATWQPEADRPKASVCD
jgi:hypothetical protein